MPINPWITNNFIDSCAFDPKYDPEDKAANEIFQLRKEKELGILIAHSTQKEIEHPNTPVWVKREAQNLIYTIETQLTRDEINKLCEIEFILAGNGKIENIRQDARHIFEAQKYGSYFITTDTRILKKSDDIFRVCLVVILKPSEFLLLLRKFIHNLEYTKSQIIEGKPMNSIVYKGYKIMPAPHELRDTGEWTINLYIAIEKGNERVERGFNAANTYKNKNEAIQHCINFGKQIIDGQVKNCTVVDLY
jgi:hypothetical protein